jgi:hypothetical protein
MSLEILGSIIVIVAIIAVVLILAIYIIRRVAQAGQAMLDDPQIQAWRRREQELERYGEWRADPDAALVLGNIDIGVVVDNFQVGQADVVVIPYSPPSTIIELVPINQFVNRELVWRLRYQNSQGCKRADLRPVGGGPTIAILELLELSEGGAVAQVGQQGYVIYQPDRLGLQQFDLAPNDMPPDVAILNDGTVIFGDGRAYQWRTAYSLYHPGAFLDTEGKPLVIFHDGHLRITPTASLDIIPALVLIEHYLYIRPLGE